MPRRARTVKSPRRTARALAERAANERARERGQPLPHPNPWDAVDPTKVPRDATPAQIHQSYLEFCRLCPPTARKKHFL